MREVFDMTRPDMHQIETDEPSAASWFWKGLAWATLTGFAVWLALQFIAALAAQ